MVTEITTIGKGSWRVCYRQQVVPGDVTIYGVVLEVEHHKEYSRFYYPHDTIIDVEDQEAVDGPAQVPIIARVTQEVLTAILLVVEQSGRVKSVDRRRDDRRNGD